MKDPRGLGHPLLMGDRFAITLKNKKLPQNKIMHTTCNRVVMRDKRAHYTWGREENINLSNLQEQSFVVQEIVTHLP